MDSTFEKQTVDSAPQSVEDAWQHGKQIFSSSTTSEAWGSFKKMFEALPIWALVAVILVVMTLVTAPWIVVAPLAAGGLLTAVYFTAKHGARAGMREHESDQIS